VPVVTVGRVGVATVNVAVAVVLLSVTVIVQEVEPVVKTADAAVFELTVGVAMLSPVQLPPLTPKSVDAVSEDQSVLVPVRVRVGVVLPAPEVGEIESVAVETEIVAVIESVVSVIVRVPVPDPVVICKVSEVEEELDLLTNVAPVTPEMLNAVLPVQVVLDPVSVTAILLLWCAGIVVGEATKLGPAAENCDASESHVAPRAFGVIVG
jgi:hypothetical protein